jgi:hypothetical protein
MPLPSPPPSVDAAVVVFCGPNFASASEQIVVTARATPPFMDAAAPLLPPSVGIAAKHD